MSGRASFDAEIRALTGARLRLVLLIGAVGFTFFVLLDRIVLPESFHRLLTIRAVTVFGFFAMLLLARHDVEHRRAEPYGVLTLLWSAASIQFMVLETGGHASAYYAGLNLVLVGAAVLMPWAASRSLIVFVGIIVLYDGTILLFDPAITDVVGFVTNNFFVVFTGVIAVSGSAASYAFRRREFESRRGLEALADFRKNVIANLSHEMRTPLTLLLGAVSKALKGAVQLKKGVEAVRLAELPAAERARALEEEVTSRSEDEVELLRDGKQSGLELLTLINDLLELSRIDAAMEFIAPEPLEARALLVDAGRIAAKYGARNGVKVHVEDGPQVPVCGDRAKIDRILKNLLSNALKFTPVDGKILLGVELEDGWAMFFVKDTGPGMRPSEAERVFERFHQIDAGIARRHGGTGIGLALVREHVEMHGGRVWIELPPEGGTCVRLRLPTELEQLPERFIDRRKRGPEPRRDEPGVAAWTQAIVDDPEYQSVRLAAATERRGGVRHNEARNAGRILIVDDTPAILRLLSYQLCGEHDVVLARSGIEALELTKRWRPNLILTDMMMPGMDGAELCRALAADPETAAIPVVLLTARTGDEARLEAHKAGAVAFLNKPCDEEELLATIRAILAQREVTAERVARYETRRTALVAEGIAHELRNPLGFVMNAQFLMGEIARQAIASLPADRADHLASALEEARRSGEEGIQRIKDMVSQVANLGDASAGAHGRCDPAAVSEAVHHLVRPRLAGRELVVDVAPAELAVSSGHLHDVLLNLTKNALDAMGEEGRIEILGSANGAAYELLVRDTGPGIPAELADAVFAPFFTTRAPGEGTGLGLAISRQKVSEVGGSLELVSPANPTTFRVRIPQPADPPQTGRGA